MRTVVVLFATAAGNLLLGRVLGDPGRLIGLFVGLIVGMLLIQPGAIRRSSVFLRDAVEEANKIVANWDGRSEYGRRFNNEFLWLLIALAINAVVWINLPKPALDLLGPVVSVQVDMWSAFFSIFESHRQQLYDYSGEDRATRISYLYATSFSLFTILSIWRIRPTIRGMVVHGIVFLKLYPKRRLATLAIAIGMLVLAGGGAAFTTIGEEIDLLSRLKSISLVANYMIGDTYWAIWKWVVMLLLFGVGICFSLVAFVLVLHWPLFFPRYDEGE